MIRAYPVSMAYYPRYRVVYDGCSFHVTWRCHNRDWLLAEHWAKKLYYDLLLKYKEKYGVKIHSYQLMENHPHLTGTMSCKELFSAFFRTVNNLFARKYNKRENRRGQVIMDRFKSPRIKDDTHMLTVMTYADLNGVRCGRDKRADDAEWSSYSYYAYGCHDPLITPATSYLALADTDEKRQQAYRKIVLGLMRKDRINISNTCFIGNPDWVKKQHETLRSEMRSFSSRKKNADIQVIEAGPP